jgi:TolA-binding protein
MLYIDRCESLLPANPERIRILRALCLTQLNRAGESVAVLKKLQADFPNSPLMPDIMFMEGWIWFQDGKNDEARPIMDVIVKKYGQSSVSRQAKQVLDELNMTR